MLVLVDAVIQAHPPGVEGSRTGVAMQTDDKRERVFVEMPTRHGKSRIPPSRGDGGSSVIVGVVDRAVTIV